MPRTVNIDIGHRPTLNANELLAIVREGFGDGYDVYKPGWYQVPDVMVKRSDREGAAIQILQQRLRKRTRLRVYGLAPSIAVRPWVPDGLARQVKMTKPLVEEVVRFLKESESLRQA
jgi:hypothetical protein